jgi:hypothetical protein
MDRFIPISIKSHFTLGTTLLGTTLLNSKTGIVKWREAVAQLPLEKMGRA